MGEPIKIAFTGAECTGKTTLALLVQKEMFPNVEVIKPTRMVKNYLGKSDDIQKQILVTYVEELMKRVKDGFICDRMLFDVCAYSMVKGVWTTSYVDRVLSEYTKTKIYPDYIFYTPIEFEFKQDGGRPEGTRDDIDNYIRSYLKKYAAVEYIELRGGIEKRMGVIKEVVT